MKAHIFLIMPGEFYSGKVYRLEDINTTVTIIKLTQLGIGSCKLRNLFLHQNGLTDLTEIWNQDFLGDDASFE